MRERRYLSPRQQRQAIIRQTMLGLVMLPLSLLPFLAYFRMTQQGSIVWARIRSAVAPVGVPHLDDGEQRWVDAHRPAYQGAVAYLVYHGLGLATTDEGFTISPDTFAEHMAYLRAAGMHPVTARDVVNARTGQRPLPDNAVMISFDDGRADAMLYADPILAETGMRATMFVISSSADNPGIYYASWDDLEQYARSGRWDIESHTSASHHEQDVGQGRSLPAMTSLAPGETLDAFTRRLDDDLRASVDDITRHVGEPPVALAYPFGSWGSDDRINDPRIPGIVRSVVTARFPIAFAQDDQATWGLSQCPADGIGLRRLEIGSWSGRELLSQLALAAKSPPAQPGACPAAAANPAP